MPRGHDAGVIVVQPRHPAEGRKSYYLFEDALKEPTIEEINSPDPEDIGRGVPLKWGDTVQGDCTTCGRPYWKFWKDVQPEIPKLVDKAVVSLTLDDDPLC
jgi:hypothetical protein